MYRKAYEKCSRIHFTGAFHCQIRLKFPVNFGYCAKKTTYSFEIQPFQRVFVNEQTDGAIKADSKSLRHSIKVNLVLLTVRRITLFIRIDRRSN